jgi:molecular chaperone GrpE
MKHPKKPDSSSPDRATRPRDGDIGLPTAEDADGASLTDPEDGLVENEPDPGDAGALNMDAVAPGLDFQRELNSQQEKYLRLAAEYDNFRKRTARERSELTSRAQADLAKQLLDALDDLGRFAHLDPATVDPATLVQGVDLVERKFMKSLNAAGLQTLDPVDQTFDPALHEAVVTEPALSPEDDHVVSRVFQVGYLFNGQLLRPARVVVKQWNG